MPQKTKSGSMLPTLIVIVGLMAAAAVIFPSDIWDRFDRKVETTDNSKEVTLVVQFTPDRSKNPILVSWGVGAALTEGDKATKSAWVRSIGRVAIGDRVTLRAQQGFGEGELGCYLEVDGKKVAPDTIVDHKAENFVVCTAIVT